jgi:hypothetical protein
MNPLIERIEHLKNVGQEATTTFPAITSVTLGVVHENIDELVEAAEHYGKKAEPLEYSKKLFFIVYDAKMNITISVTSKDAVNVTTTYSVN